MPRNPLKDFEYKFENFIRLWIRYFYNVPEYILAIEILIDKKQAILQTDYLLKDAIMDSQGKQGRERKRQEILEDLYGVYILDKREIIKDVIDQSNQNQPQSKDYKGGMQDRLKETNEQRNIRIDDSTVWGFYLDNLEIYQFYINKMKEQCESDKRKKEQEIENNESKIDCDKVREEQLIQEIEKLRLFTDVTLKFLEDKLKIVLEASKKTDIKKSLYNPDYYNFKQSQEKDDSYTFQIATETFKCKQYARLFSFCQNNTLFQPDVRDEVREENLNAQTENQMASSPEKKKKVKKN